MSIIKLATGENWYRVEAEIVTSRGRSFDDHPFSKYRDQVKAADEFGAILKAARKFMRGQDFEIKVVGNSAEVSNSQDIMRFTLAGVTKL